MPIKLPPPLVNLADALILSLSWKILSFYTVWAMSGRCTASGTTRKRTLKLDIASDVFIIGSMIRTHRPSGNLIRVLLTFQFHPGNIRGIFLSG
jgi:hypothetical protein